MTRYALSLPLIAFLTCPLGFALAAEPSSGQQLYEARCASCHGLDGKGSPGAAKDLKADLVLLDLTKNLVARRSEASLRKLVSKGHGRMPKQEALTASQVRELVRYLRSIQKEVALK